MPASPYNSYPGPWSSLGCTKGLGDTLLRSCAGPTGHHWHLGVLLCHPAALGEPRASPLAAVRWRTGDICCFFTPWKQHLLGSLLGPRQAGGEPITPMPPAVSPSAPALHGWPELQRPMGWHSCSLMLCKWRQPKADSQPRHVPGPSPAPAPPVSTARRRGVGAGGASWIFMSGEFTDQKTQSCFPL